MVRLVRLDGVLSLLPVGAPIEVEFIEESDVFGNAVYEARLAKPVVGDTALVSFRGLHESDNCSPLLTSEHAVSKIRAAPPPKPPDWEPALGCLADKFDPGSCAWHRVRIARTQPVEGAWSVVYHSSWIQKYLLDVENYPDDSEELVRDEVDVSALRPNWDSEVLKTRPTCRRWNADGARLGSLGEQRRFLTTLDYTDGVGKVSPKAEPKPKGPQAMPAVVRRRPAEAQGVDSSEEEESGSEDGGREDGVSGAEGSDDTSLSVTQAEDTEGDEEVEGERNDRESVSASTSKNPTAPRGGRSAHSCGSRNGSSSGSSSDDRGGDGKHDSGGGSPIDGRERGCEGNGKGPARPSQLASAAPVVATRPAAAVKAVPVPRCNTAKLRLCHLNVVI